LPSLAYMALRETNGAAVKAIREALGIPQGILARDVVVSQGYLSNIEAGRKQPDPAVARRIADRLGVPLDAVTYPVVDVAVSA
jgi:transcriptional regulator with XRE-family HTH domain